MARQPENDGTLENSPNTYQPTLPVKNIGLRRYLSKNPVFGAPGEKFQAKSRPPRTQESIVSMQRIAKCISQSPL